MGATGRMGRLVAELVKSDPEVELATDEADIWIDFSTPEGTQKAIALGKPLVCGTTGLPDSVLKELHTLSEKVPVLYAPNFSLGIALAVKMLNALTPHLKVFSTIKIDETHHRHKKDAPSGTALSLSLLLGTDQIESHRVGEVVGTHQITLNLPNETLTLTHEALSRKAFAQGALEAAKFIFNKPAKLYSLDDLDFATF